VLVTELRMRRYDMAVDFHGILKSALLARAARIPLRVGFAPPHGREGSARLLTHAARLGGSHLSRFERNAALVRFLGGEVPAGAPPLDLPEEAPPTGLDDYAIVHPGTSASTLYKRWDPLRYAEVCRVVRDRAGLASLVTWGPVAGERAAAEAVVGAAGGAAQLAPQTTSSAQLLALMRRARIFVGSDSGPMHLASLAGLPIVAVFGPTDALENTPFPGLPHRLLRRDVGCNPCREGCPARTCMIAVPAREVAGAALELLGVV
jgi:3-deoxy-D-manno-octulosonic-acid transferase/heptosyltransferase-1